MELEEAIERLEDIKTLLEIDNGANLELTPRQQKLLAQNLEFILNHLTKQEKMIELMSKKFSETVCFAPLNQKCNQGNKNFDKNKCIKCLKQYFEKKAEDLIE